MASIFPGNRGAVGGNLDLQAPGVRQVNHLENLGVSQGLAPAQHHYDGPEVSIQDLTE